MLNRAIVWISRASKSGEVNSLGVAGGSITSEPWRPVYERAGVVLIACKRQPRQPLP
ncbi:hypothetical protein [Methylobacterium nodulans]|uniref:hypothetical protein n=1 Tax=Methylobacterium nodulans TaxID=114616 RepID=UPI0012EDA820|nr:hypothetical protein [Methylobacterium nodulans]